MIAKALPLSLRRGRAHEVCGPGALFFAFAQGAQTRGPILWVTESWQAERINPAGFGAFVDPRRLLLATVRDQREVLAVAEDALRSGVPSLVVLEVSGPLGLTPGRRLSLAARDGGTTALTIVPEGMGSNAAETRWHCTPVFGAQPDSTLQSWSLIKNKSGTLGTWHVRWNPATGRLDVVSPAGKRPGPAGTPD